MQPQDLTLTQRVEKLEEGFQNLEDVPQQISDLQVCMNVIKESLEKGHFCVNQNIIGTFSQFITSQVKLNEQFFIKDNNHDEDLKYLNGAVSELKTQNELLNEIKTNQDSFKKQTFISNRGIIVTAIVSFIIFAAGVIIGYCKF